ncbi:unnamed protein product [Durusdinium trenchii]|uniref:Uncharacterized protein n=1 Tax=Durusdinium trenchii TaxID=1381693 RepID=A0ABP0HUX1_9DINO
MSMATAETTGATAWEFESVVATASEAPTDESELDISMEIGKMVAVAPMRAIPGTSPGPPLGGLLAGTPPGPPPPGALDKAWEIRPYCHMESQYFLLPQDDDHLILLKHVHIIDDKVSGEAGKGKTPLGRVVATMFSRYYGGEGQGTFRTTSDLDFFKGIPFTKTARRLRWQKPDTLLDTSKPKLQNFKQGERLQEAKIVTMKKKLDNKKRRQERYHDGHAFFARETHSDPVNVDTDRASMGWTNWDIEKKESIKVKKEQENPSAKLGLLHADDDETLEQALENAMDHENNVQALAWRLTKSDDSAVVASLVSARSDGILSLLSHNSTRWAYAARYD